MDTLLTAQDVARILKVAKITVYKWAQNGVLPCYKLKSSDKRKKYAVRFKMSDVETFIEKCRVDFGEKHGENTD